MNYTGRIMKTDRKKLLVIPAALLLIFVVTRFIANGKVAMKPKIGPVVDSVYALGTVRTDRQYNVRFGMNTVIRKLYVHEGDMVEPGTTLVMNDSSLVSSSPFKGVVTQVSYLEGELAPSGQVIVSVSGLGEVYVKLSLDQDSITLVRRGQEAELSFEKMRGVKIKGQVGAVYMSDDEFLVRVETDGLPEWVLPGMTCDVAIVISRKDNAVLVRSSAIQNSEMEIKRNGTRMKIRVASRIIDEDWSEITDGSILPGDLIFVDKKKLAKEKKK